MGFLMMSLTLLVLSGCADPQKVIPADQGPLFCDVEEVRVFEQHVWEWRKINDRVNLAKDLKTNTTGKRECGWGGANNSE